MVSIVFPIPASPLTHGMFGPASLDNEENSGVLSNQSHECSMGDPFRSVRRIKSIRGLAGRRAARQLSAQGQPMLDCFGVSLPWRWLG